MMWYVWAWLVPCVLGYLALNWIRRWIRINDIEKKYILVTGCDAGFGNLLAQRLDMMGCHVFAACLTDAGKNRLQSVTSRRLRAFTMDISQEEDVAQATEYVSTQLPKQEGLWGLVNNAGALADVEGPFEWQNVDDFQKACDVNTLGTIRVTMAFLPFVKKAKGRIVNMSSARVRLPLPLFLADGVSKAGVAWLSDAIRPYLAQYGVSVHLIEAGCYRTETFTSATLQQSVQNAWIRCPWGKKQEFGEKYYAILLDWMNSLVNRASPNVNDVIKAYLHALTAVSPRTRYSVGWEAKYFAVPLSYLPSFVQDYVSWFTTRSLLPLCLGESGEMEASTHTG